jgi:hypothetical protein
MLPLLSREEWLLKTIERSNAMMAVTQRILQLAKQNDES